MSRNSRAEEVIDPLFERLDAVAPHTDDFGDYDGTYALNAAAAHLHTLQYIRAKDRKGIFAVGTLYIHTIDAKLYEMDITDEDDIDGHAMMRDAPPARAAALAMAIFKREIPWDFIADGAVDTNA